MKYLNILLVTIFLCATNLFAGPFVKISSINAESDYPHVTLRVSAIDRDRNWISGLDEENILIYEDGYRVNYVQVKNEAEKNELLYLVFSLDSSKSISEKSFQKIKKSAIQIITSSSINEKIALCRFNDKVIILKNFSGNKADLIHSVENIKQHGTKTLLFDALFDSIDLVSRTETDRKAVIVFTDGKDEGSSVTFDDVVKFSNDKGIPIFVICMSKSDNIKLLRRMAKLTGGQCLEIDTIENLTLAYQRIIQNIKSLYVIKYVTMMKQDGQNHLVEVRLKYDEIRDRDVKKFQLSKESLKIRIPSFNEILLIIMMALFTVLIFVLIILLVKRKSRIDKTVKKTEKPFFEKQTLAASAEEDFFSYNDERPKGNSVPSALNPPEPKTADDYYSNAWLILQDKSKNKKFELTQDEVIIGSGNASHIIVRSNDVSEKHCCIKLIDGNYLLFDMVSERGTFLNGKKLLRPKQLYDWDEIKLGPISFIFRGSRF